MLLQWAGKAASGPTGSIAQSITSSDTAAVRTSPVLNFVDAVGISDASTTRPFQDLDYEWDSGYASTAWSTTSRSSRLSYGGAACLYYEIPEGGGNVTVNPTVTIRSPSGTTVVSLPSLTIVDPATTYTLTNTICISNDTDMTGAPAGADITSGVNITTVAAGLAFWGTGKRILFNVGDTFTTAGQILKNVASGTGVTVGKFGTGAKPIFSLTADDSRLLRIDGTNVNAKFMDINFVGPGVGSTGFAFGSGASTSKVTVLRCDASAFLNGYGWGDATVSTTQQEIALVLSTADTLTVGAGYCAIVSLPKFAMMGCTLDRDVAAAGEHCFRTQYMDRGVITNNIIRNAATNKHLIAFRAPDNFGTLSLYTQYSVVNHNILSAGAAACIQIGSENGSTDERVQQCTFDGNFITTGATSTVGILVQCSEVTVRNNIIIGTRTPDGNGEHGILIQRLAATPVCDNNRIRHNSYYNGDAAASGDIRAVRIADATTTNSFVQNNAGWANAATAPVLLSDSGTQPATVTPGRNSTNPEIGGSANAFVNATPATAAQFAPANYAVGGGAFVNVYRDFNSALRVTYDIGAVKN